MQSLSAGKRGSHDPQTQQPLDDFNWETWVGATLAHTTSIRRASAGLELLRNEGRAQEMPALDVTSLTGHCATGSDLGGQSHVQATGSTDRPRHGQGMDQGQEPSREHRQDQQEIGTEMERMEETRLHPLGFRNLAC